MFSNTRADLERHAEEIQGSIDNAAAMMATAVLVVGCIAVAALLVAASGRKP